jgi:hypothetical protein
VYMKSSAYTNRCKIYSTFVHFCIFYGAKVKIVPFTYKNVSIYSMNIWETDFDFSCYFYMLYTSTLYVAAVHEVQFVKTNNSADSLLHLLFVC